MKFESELGKCICVGGPNHGKWEEVKGRKVLYAIEPMSLIEPGQEILAVRVSSSLYFLEKFGHYSANTGFSYEVWYWRHESMKVKEGRKQVVGLLLAAVLEGIYAGK